MTGQVADPEPAGSGAAGKGGRLVSASLILSGLCALGVVLILPLGLLNVPLLSMVTVVGCLPLAALLCGFVAQAYRAPGAWQAVGVAVALIAGLALVAYLFASLMGYAVWDALG